MPVMRTTSEHEPAEVPRPGRWKHRGLAVLIAVVGSIVLFVFVEGVASTLVVAGEILADAPELAERRHTRYDPELGWVNVPGTAIADMYGPGGELVVNDQGFRNRKSFPQAVPDGKLRVICSGDSFTFGYGVANHESWCHRLSVLEPRLETVNMGQGGYGVDQAYLWYRRDGAALEHDLHVFAVVRVDFDRMRRASFLGYGKPVLRLDGGELVAGNVPVARGSDTLRRWRRRLWAIRRLRIFELSGRLTGTADAEAPPEGDADHERLAAAVFDDLDRTHAGAGRTFVAVFLPMKADVGGTKSDAWRRLLRERSRQRGFVFVDLVEWIRELPAGRIESLFIPEGALEYASAAGHYTALGNELVARELSARLRASGVLPQP